jgi:hypothetical protein
MDNDYMQEDGDSSSDEGSDSENPSLSKLLRNSLKSGSTWILQWNKLRATQIEIQVSK